MKRTRWAAGGTGTSSSRLGTIAKPGPQTLKLQTCLKLLDNEKGNPEPMCKSPAHGRNEKVALSYTSSKAAPSQESRSTHMPSEHIEQHQHRTMVSFSHGRLYFESNAIHGFGL